MPAPRLLTKSGFVHNPSIVTVKVSRKGPFSKGHKLPAELIKRRGLSKKSKLDWGNLRARINEETAKGGFFEDKADALHGIISELEEIRLSPELVEQIQDSLMEVINGSGIDRSRNFLKAALKAYVFFKFANEKLGNGFENSVKSFERNFSWIAKSSGLPDMLEYGKAEEILSRKKFGATIVINGSNFVRTSFGVLFIPRKLGNSISNSFDLVLRKVSKDDLRKFGSGLPAKERRLLLMVLDGLTLEEISGRLYPGKKISRTNVMSARNELIIKICRHFNLIVKFIDKFNLPELLGLSNVQFNSFKKRLTGFAQNMKPPQNNIILMRLNGISVLNIAINAGLSFRATKYNLDRAVNILRGKLAK